MRFPNSIWILFLSAFLSSCSTTPESSRERISSAEARAYLAKNCSKGGDTHSLASVRGEILVRSSTREFKGQYPASVMVSEKGTLTLEVTNLIGGTVATLKGDSESLEVVSAIKPQYNRKNIREYMGLPVRLLIQLLRGDLPCPALASVETDGSIMVIREGSRIWKIEKSDVQSGEVPLRVVIAKDATIEVDLLIERWNQKEAYAEKVRVKTPEGELKWNWRSRSTGH